MHPKLVTFIYDFKDDIRKWIKSFSLSRTQRGQSVIQRKKVRDIQGKPGRKLIFWKKKKKIVGSTTHLGQAGK